MNIPKDDFEEIEFEKEVYARIGDASWLREYHLNPLNPEEDKIREILKREMNYNP